MKTYLDSKGVRELVVANVSHAGTHNSYHSALFNYLFNFSKAGAELYDAHL